MVRMCCVNICGSRAGDGLTLFKVPTDPSYKEKWMNFLSPLLRKGRTCRKTLYVCQEHFTDDDIQREMIATFNDGSVCNLGPRQYLRLKETSVPSIKKRPSVSSSIPTNIVTEQFIDVDHLPSIENRNVESSMSTNVVVDPFLDVDELPTHKWIRNIESPESPLEIKLESDQQIQEHSNIEQKSARIAALESFQETFCRTCLRKIPEGDAVSLFSTKSFYNGQALYQLFMEITPTLMEQNDTLPNNICSNCARRVKQSFAFKRSIEKAHKTLIYTVRKAEMNYNSALARKLPSNFKDLLDNFSYEMSQIVDDDEGGTQSCADMKPNIANSTKPVNMEKLRQWKTSKPSILQAIPNGKQLPEKRSIANNIQDNLEIADSTIMIDSEAVDVIKMEDESDNAVAEEDTAEQLQINNGTNILDKQCSSPAEKVANVQMECDDKRIACDKCDKKFTNADILQRHLLYHSLDILQFEGGKRENHTQGPTATINTTNNTMRTTISRVSTAKITKPCEFCEKIFEVRTMRKHIRLKHKAELQRERRLRRLCFTCSKCGKRYISSSRLERHIKSRHDGKNKCDHCDKRFLRRALLDQHLHHTHGVKATSVCYICGKTINRTNIYVHIRTHILTKSVKCTVEGCHALLKYKSSLRDHLERIHSTELAHMCEICGKAFTARTALVTHLRTHLRSHSNNRQYMCQLCEKPFRTPKSLKKHILTLHQQVKTYKCPVCPQVFGYRFSMRRHCGRHHPEHPLALKKTNRPYRNYSLHPAVEKTFACIVCSKMFACDYNLKLHITRYHPSFVFSQKQVQLDEAASTIAESPEKCVNV